MNWTSNAPRGARAVAELEVFALAHIREPGGGRGRRASHERGLILGARMWVRRVLGPLLGRGVCDCWLSPAFASLAAIVPKCLPWASAMSFSSAVLFQILVSRRCRRGRPATCTA